MMLYIFKNCWK